MQSARGRCGHAIYRKDSDTKWVHERIADAGDCPDFGNAKPKDASKLDAAPVTKPDADAVIAELEKVLTGLCDSLRLRQGSNLIHVNHDELMELIPAGRAALAIAAEWRKEGK